ncbi:MAG: redoxin domain-containing protein [Myxococcota bacterium]|nr:redoxin domain-containing protein [Myxococcota bacterium]
MNCSRTMLLAVSLVAGLLVCVPVSAGSVSGPAVGATAPDFTLKDGDGQAFGLRSSLARGPVVLAFFPRAFSAASIRQWEALRGVALSFERAGVQLVGISTDSMSTLKRFKAAHRLPFRLLSDGTGDVSKTYGAIFGFDKRRLTAQKMVVVGKKGLVLYRDERYEAKTDMDLRALLRAVGGD